MDDQLAACACAVVALTCQKSFDCFRIFACYVCTSLRNSRCIGSLLIEHITRELLRRVVGPSNFRASELKSSFLGFRIDSVNVDIIVGGGA